LAFAIESISNEQGEALSGGPANLVTVYEPRHGWEFVNIREIWRYRELLFFFVWKEIKVRYKQTFLGVIWAILQPFMMMLVFSIFLGRFIHTNSNDIPYPVFVYAGLLPWHFFSTAITNASNSIVGAQNVITKIYFPRLLIPFSAVGAAAVDFFIAMTMLGALMLWYQVPLSSQVILLPIPIVLSAIAATGVGTLLAALTVSYRDFRFLIPFLVQIWLFATPVVYMSENVFLEKDSANSTSRHATTLKDESAANPQEKLTRSNEVMRLLVEANPMTGVVGFFRAAILSGSLPWKQLRNSALSITLVTIAGLLYFRKMEAHFSDVI